MRWLGFLLLLASLLTAAQVQIGAGTQINPGVRYAKLELRQASPVFIQGKMGQPGSGTVTYSTPAVAQNKSCQNVTTCAFASAQTAANNNLVIVTWVGTSADVNYLSDTRFNYYQRVFSTSTTVGTLRQNVFWSRGIAAGGNTVSVTFTGTPTTPEVQIVEVSGLINDPKDAAVAATGNNNGGATITTASMTPASDHEFLFLAGGSTYQLASDSDGSVTGYTTIQLTPYFSLAGKKIITAGGPQSGQAKIGCCNASWILQLVGFKTASSVSTPAGAFAAFDQAQAVGHTNIVVVAWQDATHNISGVADTPNGTYTKIGSTATVTSGGVTLRQAMYYAKNIVAATAGNVVTATWDGDNLPSTPTISILEYANLDTSAPLDGTAITKSGSAPAQRTLVATDAAAAATDSELMVGSTLATYGVDSVNLTDPVTTQRLLAPNRSQLVADRILLAAGNYDFASYLQANAQNWLIEAAYFKAAGQTIELPPPQLYNVAPATGSTAGGTVVTLTGKDFRPGATVKFGGVPATSVTVTDSGTISAVAPAHAAGFVDVEVNNADGGQTTLSSGFHYDAVPSYALTVNWGGTGLGGATTSPVDPNAAVCHTPTACTFHFDQGTVVTVTATPDAGSRFDFWGAPCSGNGGCVITMNAATAVTASFAAGNYFTYNFSTVETPVSDGHKFINGGSCADSTLCAGIGNNAPGSTNVVVGTSGQAHGTDNPSYPYDDSAATLSISTGTWADDQKACATIYKPATNAGAAQEVEIHLRSRIAADKVGKLYEFYWRAHTSSDNTPYQSYARWNGDGTFYQPSGWTHNGPQYSLSTGDQVCAQISGQTTVNLTSWIVGREATTTNTETDATAGRILSGNPGIGFYTSSGASVSTAGFSSFTAWDSAVVPPVMRKLTVTKTGSGTVTSQAPHGEINCGSTCNFSYPDGTVVVLAAVADAGSTFGGWGAPCTGTGSCSITLSADTTVSASFTIQGSNAYTIMAQEASTLVPYPNGFTAKKLPRAGLGGPTSHMNNEANMINSLYGARWTIQGWIGTRFNVYPATEGAINAEYYGRQDASCSATDIANHVEIQGGKVCNPAYHYVGSSSRCSSELFHAPSGAWFTAYGAGTAYDHEINIWDQNTDKVLTFYTYSTANAALPACPAGGHAGTDADPCPYSGPGNGYCGYSNVTTGRLGKLGGESTVYGNSDIESNNMGPIATSERWSQRLSGHINHALYFNSACTGTAGGAYPSHWVFPSTGGTAGTCLALGTGPDADRPPNGSLFFLDYTDAELDCLNPAKPACSGVAKVHAMQFAYIEALTYYGAYLGDTGSSGTITISRGESMTAYKFYESHGYANAYTGGVLHDFMTWFTPQCTSDWCSTRLGQADNDYVLRIGDNVPAVNGRTILQRSHFANPCVAIGLAGISTYGGVSRCAQ